MNKDFAYCKGKIFQQGVFELKDCPKRNTCKRYIPVVGDNHFVISSIPPEHDYICWVNPRECAKRDYVVYLKDDEKTD